MKQKQKLTFIFSGFHGDKKCLLPWNRFYDNHRNKNLHEDGPGSSECITQVTQVV